MPAKERIATRYPGVFSIETTNSLGKPDRAFYVRYRRRSDGKLVEEKVGYANGNDMTAAQAARIRSDRIEGKEGSNKERRAQAKAAKDAEANRWTISRLWEEYKANHPGLKGAVSDENRFANHLAPDFGAKEPHELVALDIKRLTKKLLKKRAPATARNVLELLRRIINFGVKTQLCAPIGFRIEMPKVSNLKTEDLTQAQLAKLLEAIEKAETPKVVEKEPASSKGKAKKKKDAEDIYHPDAAAMMKLVLFSGLRRGELFRLKWEHVDFQRKFLTLIDPKGGMDEQVPMNEAARALLEKRSREKDSDYVFPGRGGKQRTDINKAVNAIKAAAGLPADFRPLHGLRHAFASMLASSGLVDFYTLQKLLTHKSPQMTMRYAHLADQALQRAAAVAVDIVAQAVKPTEEDEVVNMEGHKH